MRSTSILALALCGVLAACTSEAPPSEAPAGDSTGNSTGAAPTEAPAGETAVRTVKFTVDGLT